MKTQSFLKAPITAFFIAHFFSQPCFAINLDNTQWIGTFRCKGVSALGNKYSFISRDISLKISQTGTDAEVTVNFGLGDIIYNATVYNDAIKPDIRGTLGMVYPGNGTQSSAFNELVWGKVRYNPSNGKGSFKGVGGRVASPIGFDTCNWQFKTIL